MNSLKTIQIESQIGKIEVRFLVEFNGEKIIIDNLAITKDNLRITEYDRILGVQIYNGEYKLYYISFDKSDGIKKEVYNYYDDSLSKEIAKEIGLFIEKESPQFIS